MFDADTSGGAQATPGCTYRTHPPAAAANSATLKLLQRDDVPGHVSRVSPALQQRLRGLKDKHALVGDVRDHGLMLGIELREIDALINDPAFCEAALQVFDAWAAQGLVPTGHP